MSDEELKIGYMRRFNRVLDQDNMTSLKNFIRNFELEDYTDFQEMYDAMLQSMSDVFREVEQSNNPREVIRRRYSKL
jgi:chemotaxis methyl-accepting protein methylase